MIVIVCVRARAFNSLMALALHLLVFFSVVCLLYIYHTPIGEQKCNALLVLARGREHTHIQSDRQTQKHAHTYAHPHTCKKVFNMAMVHFKWISRAHTHTGTRTKAERLAAYFIEPYTIMCRYTNGFSRICRGILCGRCAYELGVYACADACECLRHPMPSN